MAIMIAVQDAALIEMPELLFLLVVVVLAVMTPILIRRRKGPGAPKLRDIREIVAEEDKVRRSADQALVDLMETGREISAQIDTKIRVLNKLVKDADTMIQRLESILEAEGRPLPAKSSPGAQKDGGQKVMEAAETPSAPAVQPASVTEPPVQKTRSGRWISDIHKRIEKLHGEGRSPAEIARLTRLSIQEVNLVLHMLSENH